MKTIAQVEIISCDSLHIFKWFRREAGMSIKEAKDKSREKIIDFDGDYEKAIQFFKYLQTTEFPNIARLIVDYFIDYSQAYLFRGAGANAICLDLAQENNKLKNEFDQIN